MFPLLSSTILIINLIAFVFYGFDKVMAKAHRRRVPERVLLMIGIFGGAFGALIGMILFRHKIRQGRFWLILIPCALVHLGLFFYLELSLNSPTNYVCYPLRLLTHRMGVSFIT